MRRYLGLLLACFFGVSLIAQNSFPYQLTKRNDWPLLGGGLVVAGLSLNLENNTSPLNMASIEALDRQNVIRFDRFATNYYSPTAESFSDVTLYSSLGLPFLFALDRNNHPHLGKIGLISLEGAIITVGLTNLAKVMTLRPRPLTYNDDAPIELKTIRKARFSFFSGHTSMSAYFSFSSAQIFSDLYPDSRWKPVVWASAAVLPALTAYGRVRAGKHYLTDVLAGYAIGAFVGIIIPRLHRKVRRRDRRISAF